MSSIQVILILGIIAALILPFAAMWAYERLVSENGDPFDSILVCLSCWIFIPAIIALTWVLVYVSIEDRAPVVSPSISLVRSDAPTLFASPTSEIRGAELIANWHYVTKKICESEVDLESVRCVESRIKQVFAIEDLFVSASDFFSIENSCRHLRSDRYGVCLMSQYGERARQSVGGNGNLVNLNANKYLKFEACQRARGSVHCG